MQPPMVSSTARLGFAVALGLLAGCAASSDSDVSSISPSGGRGGAGGADSILDSAGAGGDTGGDTGGLAGFDPTTGCPELTYFVYAIDRSNVLYRFDPRLRDGTAFLPVGAVGCSGGDRPNSMAVARNGEAWVAYISEPTSESKATCTSVQRVSLKDASCLGPAPVTCNDDFQRFGMAFVSDGAGSTKESLYVLDGDSKKLGVVDTQSGAISAIGTFAEGELTGTGNGALWSFAPSGANSAPLVVELNKANASVVRGFELTDLTPPNQEVYSFAFAHWGGAYFMFYHTASLGPSSNVYRLDPNETGYDTWIQDAGVTIIGAGVSTCAPVEVVIR